jgi:hypothetical protein
MIFAPISGKQTKKKEPQISQILRQIGLATDASAAVAPKICLPNL